MSGVLPAPFLSRHVNGTQRMASTKERHPRLAFDVIIVTAGIAFLLLIWAAGVRAGQPVGRGTGTVLGGLYATYLGVLFLLSSFFPDATYILSFLRLKGSDHRLKGSDHRIVYFAFVFSPGWLRFSLTDSFA